MQEGRGAGGGLSQVLRPGIRHIFQHHPNTNERNKSAIHQTSFGPHHLVTNGAARVANGAGTAIVSCLVMMVRVKWSSQPSYILQGKRAVYLYMFVMLKGVIPLFIGNGKKNRNRYPKK